MDKKHYFIPAKKSTNQPINNKYPSGPAFPLNSCMGQRGPDIKANTT